MDAAHALGGCSTCIEWMQHMRWVDAAHALSGCSTRIRWMQQSQDGLVFFSKCPHLHHFILFQLFSSQMTLSLKTLFKMGFLYEFILFSFLAVSFFQPYLLSENCSLKVI